MIGIVQLAAAASPIITPDPHERAARRRHVMAQLHDTGEHGRAVKFEHCPHPLCANARIFCGIDQRMLERWRANHPDAK